MSKTIKFINKVKLIHGDRYDYSNVEYIKSDIKVKIICPLHGEFEQSPNNHLKGSGCKKCANENQTKSNEDFINKSLLIHEGKYDYSLVKYVNNKTKVKIICPTHGEFEQSPKKHLEGKGCYSCGIEKIKEKTIKSNDTFIDEAKKKHNDKYDYSLVNYVNSHLKTEFICPEHGIFEQAPYSHLLGKGCPKCGSVYDKSEGEVKEFISSLNLLFEENNRKILKGKELDIYIPSYNLAIEYNGLYWHSDLYLDNKYHFNKTESCEAKGIKLIHIFEDEWIYKQEIVKSRLTNIFGLNSNKIYGRKCVIKEITSKEAKEFLNNNHIQGGVNAKYNIGLYYNNELVSIMTFGSLRKNMGRKSIDGHYELLRFCNKLYTSVVGGADKLLKYFIKTYNPKEITSYADRRWSQGDLYEKLGFEFIHNSKPNYFYINRGKREHRFKYRKDVLVKEGFDNNKTENEIMKERGFNRIYDCGNKKYVLKILNI